MNRDDKMCLLEEQRHKEVKGSGMFVKVIYNIKLLCNVPCHMCFTVV
jgi:hypothetical protein